MLYNIVLVSAIHQHESAMGTHMGLNTGSIPGPGRFPGGGTGNPLQRSSQDNHMDRGALVWGETIVYRVAKSQTQLKRLSVQARMYN